MFRAARCICLVFICLRLLPAQDTPKHWSTTVSLSVDGIMEGPLRNQVQSYIGRELRKLGDITIVDDKPEYTISLIGYNTNTKLGQTVGFTLSILVTKPVLPGLIQ